MSGFLRKAIAILGISRGGEEPGHLPPWAEKEGGGGADAFLPPCIQQIAVCLLHARDSDGAGAGPLESADPAEQASALGKLTLVLVGGEVGK